MPLPMLAEDIPLPVQCLADSAAGILGITLCFDDLVLDSRRSCCSVVGPTDHRPPVESVAMHHVAGPLLRCPYTPCLYTALWPHRRLPACGAAGGDVRSGEPSTHTRPMEGGGPLPALSIVPVQESMLGMRLRIRPRSGVADSLAQSGDPAIHLSFSASCASVEALRGDCDGDAHGGMLQAAVSSRNQHPLSPRSTRANGGGPSHECPGADHHRTGEQSRHQAAPRHPPPTGGVR